MVLPAFGRVRPTDIDEALAGLGEGVMAYSGGTELLLAMKMGLLTPALLVDLKGIASLRSIAREGDTLAIGAGATHDDIARNVLVREHAPLLADIEARVGNARVRASGTIGGNLCFAEPRSDVATVLAAMDASVVLRSAVGSRTIPVADFLVGPYWTQRLDEELLTAVVLPLPAATGAYLKFQITERPTVGVAAVRLTDGTGRCRVAVGAVSELPMLFEFDNWDQVDSAAVAEGIEPLEDLNGSTRYKRNVVRVYVERAVASVREGGRPRD